MDENKNVVHFDAIPQIHTGSFLTKEQAEQFKKAFKDMTVVVRCKYCKHQNWVNAETENIVCKVGRGTNPPDWFCADGEMW